MITIAQVEEVIGDVPDAEEPALQNVIDRATATLGRLLGWYFGPPEDRIEVKAIPPAPHNGVLYLNEHPSDPPTISIRSRGSAFETYAAVVTPDSGGIVWTVDGRMIAHRDGWPIGRGTVEVTYEAGYVPGSGPKEIEAILLQMVTETWNSMGTTELGEYKQRTLDDHSWTKWTPAEIAAAAGSLGLDWKDLVRRWSRRLV